MESASKSISIHNVAGVISQYDIPRLRKIIFRATKGKSFMLVQDFEEEEEEDQLPNIQQEKRSVYIIVYWDGDTISEKIQRICDSFSGKRYDLPEQSEFDGKIEEVTKGIDDSKDVYLKTREQLRE